MLFNCYLHISQTQLNSLFKLERKLFNSIIFYVIQLLFTYNSNSTKFFILKNYLIFNYLVGKLFDSIIFYVIQLLFTHKSNSTKFFILICLLKCLIIL